VSGRIRGVLASLSARGVAGCLSFVRRTFDPFWQPPDREAVREAERLLEMSGQKLTDETERKMMERITRNQSFKP